MVRKIEPGDVIGRCRIIRELGRGGVGTVYLATHQTLQIEVALKILSPALSLDNPALAERFIREAQMAARIRHPNVIAVMDAAHDETTGLYFIVQEFVGGGALSWHLRNGPLTEQKALSIITGIAQALVVAEENSIVHRDIKPDNIMLDSRGTAKLADLGLAKNAIDTQITLTLGGSFMGTPAYMSPEQARDAKVADTRDDIYSLGATFYECLTGRPPFTGETPYNIMSELLTKPSPKPRADRPELSRSVDLVCRKMMAKTRGLRYSDARTLLQDLHHCSVVGDSGMDGLEAVSFEKDSIMARQQAFDFGVQPTADNAGAIPNPPRTSATDLPPRADASAFRAAALLVVLVVSATLLLLWFSPGNFWSNVKEQVDVLKNDLQPSAQVPPKVVEKSKKPVTHHPVAKETKPAGGTVTPSTEKSPTTAIGTAQPEISVAPVVQPLTTATNIAPVAVPAIPMGTNVAGGVIPDMPAIPALPDSAFQALTVAEQSLPPAVLDPVTGRAQLLKIRGKKSDNQVVPTIWTFDFFDQKAAGHARIVSVSDHRVVDNGERVTFIISPYTKTNVLPPDVIDSTQAFQIAQGLVPGVTISSSQFILNQEKNSAPFWTLTLWAKNPEGEEIQLGNVVLLAQKGDVISNSLKPDRIKE